VVPKTEAMMKNKHSKFTELRKSGMPASQVRAEVADPVVEMVSNAPDAMLLNIGEIFTYEWKDPAHTLYLHEWSQKGQGPVGFAGWL
jgi:hypothetical protein